MKKELKPRTFKDRLEVEMMIRSVAIVRRKTKRMQYFHAAIHDLILLLYRALKYDKTENKKEATNSL